MNEMARRRVIAGVILILVGIVLLIQQFTRGFGDDIILLLIGAAFLTAYFLRRVYGFLIPGCILMGLGLGSVGDNAYFGVGDFSAIGLGVGFIAIYVIGYLYQGESHWWPLIPGGILLVTGIASLSDDLEHILAVGWPALLILAGLLLLGGALGLFGKKPDK